eukprot:CAMPEP_0171985062 /NCGR_PEP_ID=MMETSP0993-20121228/274150_1 /TAXON_ID=483369 /ORGANISM="non described non described, Strain CCMP2098" /LENGTH=812 /DNA_ID=CAMNT_0012637907 /DNA_START=15 /DNA_END=2454 /DNA_ORIENTATION=+
MVTASSPTASDIENPIGPSSHAPVGQGARQDPPAVIAVKLHEDDIERDRFAKPVCQDSPWALLFIAQLTVIFVLAMVRGIPECRLAARTGEGGGNMGDDHGEWGGYDAESTNSGGDSNNAQAASQQPTQRRSSPLMALVLVLGSAGLAGAASLVLFEQALRHPERVIRFGLFGLVAMSALLALLCLASGAFAGVLLWGLLTALGVCFVRSVENRIPFAVANLTCAVAAIKQHKATVCVAIQAFGYQGLWVALWLVALLGFALRNIRERQAGMPTPSSAYFDFEREALDSDSAPPSQPALPSGPSATPRAASAQGDEGADFRGYYGLGPGCRSVLVTHASAVRDFHLKDSAWLKGSTSGAYGTTPEVGEEESGGVGLFCACSGGQFLAPLQCGAANLFRVDLGHHALVYVLFLLSFYWALKLISGVVHVTSSGVVAAWWFGGDGESRQEEGAGSSSSSSSSSTHKGYMQLAQVSTEPPSSQPPSQSSQPWQQQSQQQQPPGEDNGGEAIEVPEAIEAQGSGGGGNDEGVEKSADTGGTGTGGKSVVRAALAPSAWALLRLHLLGLPAGTGTGGKSVVRAALARALGPSFGSICLGSLLVALLSTAETVVKYCRDSCGADAAQGDPEAGLCYVCLCCLGLVLNVLRDLLEYFNRWAFTYVAVYGDSFVSAGKSTHALFKRRAWSSIVSDTLCSLSLSLASLALAVLLGLGAFVCASLLLSPEARGAVALAAFLSAYVVCSCVVSVLDAGVLTVIVCFAEDPFAGLASHPEEFGRLMESGATSSARSSRPLGTTASSDDGGRYFPQCKNERKELD